LILRSVIAEAQREAEAARSLASHVEDRRGNASALFRGARQRGGISADADLDLAAEALTAFAWFKL
jgi:hypothetical protein